MPVSQRRAGRRDKRDAAGANCGRRDARESYSEHANERGRVGLSAELGGLLLWTGNEAMWPRKKNPKERESVRCSRRHLTIAA